MKSEKRINLALLFILLLFSRLSTFEAAGLVPDVSTINTRGSVVKPVDDVNVIVSPTSPSSSTEDNTTVNDSESYNHTLTISIIGEGWVTGAESGTYAHGTEIMLQAVPESNSVFTGWTGDVISYDEVITITVENDVYLTANFDSEQLGNIEILRFESQHTFGEDKANSDVIAPLVDMYDCSFYYQDVIPGVHEAGGEVVAYWNFLSVWEGSSWFQEAQDNGWALRDANMNYVYEVGHSENKVVDPGSQLYREKLVAFINEQMSVGYDGMFADNSGFIYPQTDWLLSDRPINPRTGELYTDEEWLNDVIGLIEYVKTNSNAKIVSNGMLYNGHEYYKPANTPKYDYFLNNADIDILFIEGIFNNMGAFYDEEDWIKSLDLVIYLQNNFLQDPNKSLVLWSQTSYGVPDWMSKDEASLFIFASSLLGISESGQNYIACHGNMDSTFTQDLFNLEIGVPLEDYQLVEGTHVYERDYSKAKILVNPTTSSNRVMLGAEYRTLNGLTVSEITLEKISATILFETSN